MPGLRHKNLQVIVILNLNYFFEKEIFNHGI